MLDAAVLFPVDDDVLRRRNQAMLNAAIAAK